MEEDDDEDDISDSSSCNWIRLFVGFIIVVVEDVELDEVAVTDNDEVVVDFLKYSSNALALFDDISEFPVLLPGAGDIIVVEDEVIELISRNGFFTIVVEGKEVEVDSEYWWLFDVVLDKEDDEDNDEEGIFTVDKLYQTW